MYGPPRDCQREMSFERQPAKMYPAYLWSDAPGHDENPRTSVLLHWYGLKDRFFDQACDVPFDCSVILVLPADSVGTSQIRRVSDGADLYRC